MAEAEAAVTNPVAIWQLELLTVPPLCKVLLGGQTVLPICRRYIADMHGNSNRSVTVMGGLCITQKAGRAFVCMFICQLCMQAEKALL